MSQRYIARKIEPELKRLSQTYKVVTLLGPRQSGKSTLVKSIFQPLGYGYVNLEDSSIANQAMSDMKGFLINHPAPLIIDEIQKVPELVSQIQADVDESGKPGSYILTGSYQESLSKSVAQSLAGRTSISHLLPLSIEELGCGGYECERNSLLVNGFMPQIYSSEDIVPYEYYSSYKQTFLERDIRQSVAFRNIREFHLFMDVLAGRVSSLVNQSAVANDVGVSSPTVGNWISLLEAAYIIYLLPPWSKNRTSRAIKSPKLYFTEPGLVASYLGLSDPRQAATHPLLGAMFENMVVIEALKARYNCNREPRLYFYRDNNGVEVDLILEKSSREVDLFEIKAAYSFSKDFKKGMDRFAALHPDLAVTKHVIYAGESLPSPVDGVTLIGFKDVWKFFQEEAKPRLRFGVPPVESES